MSLLALNTMRMVSRRSFSVASVRLSDDAGSIRGAGGKFAEKEAAIENAYFKKVESEQLEALKKKHDNEIKNHEKQIQNHLVRLNFFCLGAKRESA